MLNRWHAFLIVVVMLLGPVTAARTLPPPLESYRTAIVQQPSVALNYYRVFLYGRNHPARRDDARALLQWCYQRYPRGHRIGMFIAWLDQLQGRSGWKKDFLRSIDGMRSTGDNFGVAYAGEILAYILIDQGRLGDAERLIARCLPAARRTGKPWMEARLWSVQAVLAQVRGDYSTALHLLLRTKKVVFPDGEYDIQCSVMNNLGGIYWYLGRFRKAYAAWEEAAHLRARAGDVWGETIPLSNMALCGIELVHEGEMPPEELQDLLDRGLALAIRGGNADTEAAIHNVMGRRREGRVALRHFRMAREIARRHDLHEVEIESLQFSGDALAGMGASFSGRAARFYHEAEERAEATGHRFLVGEVLASEARLKALYGTPEEAVQAHEKALAFIEGLRAPLVRGTVRAQAFSHWGFLYYRLAGLLLARSRAARDPQANRELAFRTIERFRARELLERLVTPREASSPMMESALYRQRQSVLTQIAGTQKRLADPELDTADRRAALCSLQDLEEEEASLRDRVEQRFPEPPPSGDAIPNFHKIQMLLEPGQALLSYQLWDGEPWAEPRLEIGRSWLILVTKDRIQAIALDARRQLRGRVEILEGLLRFHNNSAADGLRASVRLYHDLLGQALAALPKAVHRLVIVPDDVLFRCPFGALRPTMTADPIGRRYEISIVPSAAVWMQLKSSSLPVGREPRSAALIFCAPDVGSRPEGKGSLRSAGPWRSGLHLAPLPHAEEEARRLRHAAGRGSQILSGAEASEAALKQMSLEGYGILDLVTHAVVDEEQPERSAIILAPGDEREDGFLQVREIPSLKLDGQLVILSSCSSSSGQLLGGEGAQSLARAFLEAGAGSVLASLWPLEDQEAAELLGDVSKELGRGQSVAGALRAARRAAMDGGMPPSGWAGVIVLGNGDARPLRARKGSIPWGVPVGIAIMAIFMIGVVRLVL